MSYLISIQRVVGDPILIEELLATVRNASDLKIEQHHSGDDEVLFSWISDGGGSIHLRFSNGVIESTTTPSNAALRRLQDLATELDARLFGEEGEDLTDVDVPRFTTTCAAPLGCLTIAAACTGLTVWWWC